MILVDFKKSLGPLTHPITQFPPTHPSKKGLTNFTHLLILYTRPLLHRSNGRVDKEINSKEVDKIKNIYIFKLRANLRSYVLNFKQIGPKMKIYVKEVNEKTSFQIFFIKNKSNIPSDTILVIFSQIQELLAIGWPG